MTLEDMRDIVCDQIKKQRDVAIAEGLLNKNAGTTKVEETLLVFGEVIIRRIEKGDEKKIIIKDGNRLSKLI